MIKIDKQYLTRDGRKVRIYATDGAFPTPIHGAVLSVYDQAWFPMKWYEDGRYRLNPLAVSLSDLVELKPFSALKEGK